MRLLIVEDNPDLADTLRRLLAADGHAVDIATDGEGADATLSAEAFDLVVLDLGLPDMDGMEVLKNLRARGSETAVLVLTARGGLDDRVRGLDLGADDYLAKPFEVEELEARVRALLRRKAGASGGTLRVGRLEFEVGTRRLRLCGEAVELPRRELDVLEALVLRHGRVVSKRELADSVSGFDEPLSDTAVELYISRLRRKLEPAGLRVRVLRGLGYVLEDA
ncbi:response regulator transcription factor [Caenispirillum salinarum]|uniref:response regulator transcription factor n=1 Tax=Caenispirillum salinarum TaxID=859058 RepID=UPI00384B11CB